MPVDDYELALVPRTRFLVFLVATSGAGETPLNMRRFWRFLLTSALPPTCLAQARVCIFGLGDSSYPLFNAAAQRLAARLAQLGAGEGLPLSLGDDQHRLGVFSAFEPWLESLPLVASRALSVDLAAAPTAAATSATLVPSFTVAADAVAAPPPLAGEPRFEVPRGFSVVPLVGSERLTSGASGREVLSLEFAVGGAFAFEPGDVAVVLPSQRPSVVSEFLELFPGLDPGAPVRIEVNGGSRVPRDASARPLPAVATPREIFTHHLDVAAVPGRDFFERLAAFATDELQREKLAHFGRAEGSEEVLDYARRPRRTIIEVLADFHSARPPLEHLLDLIPPIRPRAFSIASAMHARPGRLRLCVAVVDYKTPLLARRRVGMCSSWLAALVPGRDSVPLALRVSPLRLPTDKGAPVIMVGPGTGVAPFMAFLDEIRLTGGRQGGVTALFFGCRRPDDDYLFRGELEAALADGVLTHLFTAFSREQVGTVVYVQDRIRENATMVASWLCDPRARVYIAGAARAMPKQVRAAFVAALVTGAHQSDLQAEETIRAMEAEKRYISESW